MQTVSIDKLAEIWTHNISELGADPEAAKPVFDELVKCYQKTEKDESKYHTLVHIENLLKFVEQYKDHIDHVPRVVMAVFFHDAIYETRRLDNEERSAAMAMERLTKLGVAKEDIQAIEELILSTRKHELEKDTNDHRFFLDLDLAILGSAPEKYQAYSEAIADEYSWAAKIDYIPGRTKVLNRFLSRDNIYFTEVFREQREAQARQNMQAEIEQLKQQ